MFILFQIKFNTINQYLTLTNIFYSQEDQTLSYNNVNYNVTDAVSNNFFVIYLEDGSRRGKFTYICVNLLNQLTYKQL